MCAYDWVTDFGHVSDLQPEFIVGLMQLPSDIDLTLISCRKLLTDCDFLITDPKMLEQLATLFFANEITDLVRQLVQHEPRNRFTESNY